MAVSRRLRFEILRRDGFRCRYCGLTAASAELRVDHVIPEALGGSDDPDNLTTACEPCNSGKTSVPLDAPTVAEISADAERWSRAIQFVAYQRTQIRNDRFAIKSEITHTWDRWKVGNKPVPRPDDWSASVFRFLDAGLEMGDLVELIEVAMNSGAATPDVWKYFCGCCWRRVRETHDIARRLINDVPDYFEQAAHHGA